MSRTPSKLATANVSFPRSRGDEPNWGKYYLTWKVFSPLTRG